MVPKDKEAIMMIKEIIELVRILSLWHFCSVKHVKAFSFSLSENFFFFLKKRDLKEMT